MNVNAGLYVGIWIASIMSLAYVFIPYLGLYPNIFPALISFRLLGLAPGDLISYVAIISLNFVIWPSFCWSVGVIMITIGDTFGFFKRTR